MRIRTCRHWMLVVALLFICALPATAYARDFHTVKERELLVAHHPDNPPFEYVEGGQSLGFNVEIIAKAARGIHLRPVFVPMDLGEALDGLRVGTVDLVSFVPSTELARQEWALATPWLKSSLVALVRRKSTFDTLDNLSGHPVVVVRGMAEPGLVERALGREPIYALDNTEMIQGVYEGYFAACAIDRNTAAYLIAQHPSWRANLKIISEPLGEISFFMAALPANRGLIDALNREMDKLKESGAYEDIFLDWFFHHSEDYLKREESKRLGKSMALLAAVAVLAVFGLIILVTVFQQRRTAQVKLRESEARYRLLFESETDALLVFDADTLRFEDVNQAAQDLYGYTREEFLSLTVEDISAEKEKTRLSIQSMVEGEADIRHIPIRYHKKKDGTVFPTEISSGTFVEHGRKKLIGAIRDITERLKFEEALREKQELLSFITANIPHHVFWKDRDSVYLGCNESFASAAGVASPEEIVGKTDYDLAWKREEADSFVKCDREVMEKGEPMLDIEEPQLRADGTQAIVLTSKVPLKDSQGNITGILGIYADITEIKQAEEALRESEENYRLLVDNLPSVVYRGYKDWSVEFYDDKIEHLTGYGRYDFNAGKKKWSEIILPEDMGAAKARFVEALKENKPYVREYRIRVETGEVLWIQERGKILFDEDGEIDHISGVFFDITDRKLVQEALRESQAYLDAIINRVADPLIVKDEKHRWVLVNDAFCELVGRKREELIGKSDYDFFPKHEAEVFWKMDDEVLAGGAENINEETITHASGKVIDMVTKKTLYTSPAGEKFVVAIGRDVTEQKRARELLKRYSEDLEQMVEERTAEVHKALSEAREATDRIDGILKSVAGGLIVTDERHRIALMNRAAEEMLGVNLSEVISMPVDVAMRDRALVGHIKGLLEDGDAGAQFDFDVPGDDPKRPNTLRARSSVIFDREKRATGVVTSIHDITPEREVDRMKNLVITTTAHEFRTPLTSILGYTEILMAREDLSPEDRTKFLAHIHNQSHVLAKLIDELLILSHIESGRGLVLNKVRYNIGDQIRQTLDDFRAKNTGHDFELLLPEESTEICADEAMIGQVLSNLLSNAVKYSPKGGRIAVSGRVYEEGYLASIEDEGTGLTGEQVEKVFDKFYRVDSSPGAVEGKGLGMTITQYIVEAHRGKIWVDSELGRGTTVSFWVPLNLDDAC